MPTRLDATQAPNEDINEAGGAIDEAVRVTVLKPAGIRMLPPVGAAGRYSGAFSCICSASMRQWPCRFIAAYFCGDMRALGSRDALPAATIKTTGALLRMTCSLALDSSGGQRQGAEPGITVAAQEIV